MSHWGITGWDPFWLNSADELLAQLCAHIRRGGRISHTYTVWDRASSWFDNAPVILVIDEIQHEFRANKFDEYSYTRNTIDISAPVFWCDSSCEEDEMLWHRDRHRDLCAAVGMSINDFGVIEYAMSGGMAELLARDWVLGGVYLRDADKQVDILNNLDCNGVRLGGEADSCLRYRSGAA